MFTLKPFNKLAVLIFVLISIFIVINLTGAFRLYTQATNSMEPNIKKGTHILISNLKSLNSGNVIAFNFEIPDFENEVYLFRLIGRSNDTILIKEGKVYLNGNLVDDIMTAHDYKVTKSEYAYLKSKNEIISDYDLKRTKGDSILVTLNDKIAKKNKLVRRRFVRPENYVDNIIEETYGYKWNKDFFGPLIISENNFFVLGDNRDNSYDSRYIGLVNKKEITGTVIAKY